MRSAGAGGESKSGTRAFSCRGPERRTAIAWTRSARALRSACGWRPQRQRSCRRSLLATPSRRAVWLAARRLSSEKACALRVDSPAGLPLPLRQGLKNPISMGQLYANRIRAVAGRKRGAALGSVSPGSRGAGARPREEGIAVGRAPAIVSEEQFASGQARLAQNRQFALRNSKAEAYLVRALVSCGVCQLACTGRTLHPDYAYYWGKGKAQLRISRRPARGPARSSPALQLEALVWPDLCQSLLPPESLTPARPRAPGEPWLPPDLHARRRQLRQGHQSLTRQPERVTEAYLAGVIPLAEYRPRRQELEQKSHALANQDRRLTPRPIAARSSLTWPARWRTSAPASGSAWRTLPLPTNANWANS